MNVRAVFSLWVAIGGLAIFPGGCFVASNRYEMSEPLSRKIHQVTIVPGVTTRQELLERFGPPVAVAREGTMMVFPPPGPGMRGRMDIASDTFFELFSAGGAERTGGIIYYYESSGIKAVGVLVIPIIGAGYNSTRINVQRLWVLIDERSGIVREYDFRGNK